MVELRDCVQKLISEQMDGFISDETIRQTQAELNTLYDGFTAKYGLINSRANALAFAEDSSYYLLALWRSWTRTKTSSARQICSPSGRFVQSVLSQAWTPQRSTAGVHW